MDPPFLERRREEVVQVNHKVFDLLVTRDWLAKHADRTGGSDVAVSKRDPSGSYGDLTLP